MHCKYIIIYSGILYIVLNYHLLLYMTLGGKGTRIMLGKCVRMSPSVSLYVQKIYNNSFYVCFL